MLAQLFNECCSHSCYLSLINHPDLDEKRVKVSPTESSKKISVFSNQIICLFRENDLFQMYSCLSVEEGKRIGIKHPLLLIDIKY